MRTNTRSRRWNPGHSREIWADETWGQLCFWATRASALRKLEVKKTCERRVEQYRLRVVAPAKPSEMQKPDRRALPRSETENNHWPLPAEESATQNRNRDRAWTTYDRNEMRGWEKSMRKNLKLGALTRRETKDWLVNETWGSEDRGESKRANEKERQNENFDRRWPGHVPKENGQIGYHLIETRIV
jgi:hypothetical protein